jgi:hypothetical protein
MTMEAESHALDAQPFGTLARAMTVPIRFASTERGAFAYVAVLWAVSFFSGLDLPILIALLCLIRYRRQFVEIAKSLTEREWPYSLFIAIGLLFVVVIHPISSIVANFIVENVTGVYPSVFPNSVLFFQLAFYLFLLIIAFTLTSGLIALAIGFSDKESRRVFPVAFALAFPGVMLLPASARDVSTVESIIQRLDFSDNERFQVGRYISDDGHMHDYKTAACPDGSVPAGARLAPNPHGGYILARPKPTPQLHNGLLSGTPVQTTAYAYEHLSVEKCPLMNQFIDEPKVDSR